MSPSFELLGTGASAGVPVVGCRCAVCSSDHPRNRRLRPAGLLRCGGGKVIAFDVGPDFRAQALRIGLERVDGVCFTHTHYDHVAGVDELRIFYLRTDRAVPCLLSRESFADLHERYAYLFRPQGTGSVAAQLEIDLLEGESGERMFLGVPLRFFSYSQANVKVTGYRIGDFAYVTDIKEFDVDIFRHFKGVRRLVLSALEPTSSRCHLSIQEAIDFAEASGVEETWLTHLSHRVDYAAVSAQLPPRVHLGYDGLVLPVGGISHG